MPLSSSACPQNDGVRRSAWFSRGLLASQGVGILIGGALAQVLGPEPVVALAGVAGLSAAAILAIAWTESRTEIIAKVHTS